MKRLLHAAVGVLGVTSIYIYSRTMTSKMSPNVMANAGVLKYSLDDFDLLDMIYDREETKIFKVKRRGTGHTYALKVIEKTTKREDEKPQGFIPNRGKRLLTEGHILRNLNSPFIVKLYACFQTMTHAFFVMEYLSGPTLANMMKEAEKLPEELALFYIAEIAIAIQYLEANDILHRDLNFQNIMLDDKGHIRIIDFNTAQRDASTYNCFMFPIHYFPPPELVYQSRYGFSGEWWMVGIILYYMLTGVLPFGIIRVEEDESDEEFYSRCWNAIKLNSSKVEIPTDSDISDNAASAIRGFLNADPATRLGTGGSLQEHPFFQKVNWEQMKLKIVKPPIKFESKRLDPQVQPVNSAEFPELIMKRYHDGEIDQEQYNEFNWSRMPLDG